VVADHGDGNTRRLPLRAAEEGVPREARKRKTACHLLNRGRCGSIEPWHTCTSLTQPVSETILA